MADVAERPLTLKQQQFVLNYADPESETFGNQTRSYMTAYNRDNYSACSTDAHRMLKNPRVRKSIEQILAEENAGYEVRIKALNDLALGRTTTTTTTESKIGKTKTKSTMVREIPASDRIKALKLLHDLTGETAEAHAKGEVMSEQFKRLSKSMLKRQERDVTPRGEAQPGEVVESHHDGQDGPTADVLAALQAQLAEQREMIAQLTAKLSQYEPVDTQEDVS